MTTAPATSITALPFDQFRSLPLDELEATIRSVKEAMGPRLLILGHHYQQDEVIRFADLRGDSFKLARMAASSDVCTSIVFCGVHFMAETADILTRDDVDVILPDLAAGCSMADMADLDAVEAAWSDLADMVDVEDVVPVTYINSTADLKAFCGRHGGVVCTSSNARAILDWAFGRGSRVLFFPDQHLGRNTARGMGISLDRMPVWDPRLPRGGNSLDAILNSKVLLWKGHCSVHQMFKPAHVQQLRAQHPGIRVLVHPECMASVVDAADLVGSTEFILDTVASSPAGSRWAIGTELHLVNRLAADHPDKQVVFLSPLVCMCSTMYRIDLPHLAWSLENLARGTPVNIVKVDETTAEWARIALRRMLEIV